MSYLCVKRLVFLPFLFSLYLFSLYLFFFPLAFLFVPGARRKARRDPGFDGLDGLEAEDFERVQEEIVLRLTTPLQATKEEEWIREPHSCHLPIFGHFSLSNGQS